MTDLRFVACCMLVCLLFVVVQYKCKGCFFLCYFSDTFASLVLVLVHVVVLVVVCIRSAVKNCRAKWRCRGNRIAMERTEME